MMCKWILCSFKASGFATTTYTATTITTITTATTINCSAASQKHNKRLVQTISVSHYLEEYTGIHW